MSTEWKRRFWSSTISGYIGVVVRLLLGLVMFRQMFQHFTPDQFGFWALLWSLFGYGILLDFGFGFTAQKNVAEKVATGDMEGLSKLLATILWTFIGIGLLLLLIFLVIREPFLTKMGISTANQHEFGNAYLVFFIGLAFMFPMGLFPEVLKGLQRIDLANWIGITSYLLNCVFLLWGLWAHWDFALLMAVSVITSILPNVGAAIAAVRRLPGVSFSPRLFEWRAVRAQMSFSIVAYLITFSNLLMGKSDQLVISMTIGVAAIAIYQAGFKMAEMLNFFAGQLLTTISPAAASLRALGDHEGLRQLYLQSSRLTFLLVTPAYVLAAVYLNPLIHVLTGNPTNDTTWWIGQVLLFTIYSSQITNGSSKRVLMMSGGEKIMLRISLVEGLTNLILSIILVHKFKVLGVAIGTMIPTLLTGWLWVMPVTLKRLNIGMKEYFKHRMSGTVVPLLAFGVVTALVATLIPGSWEKGEVKNFVWLADIGWRGLLCMLPLILLGRKTIASISR